MDNFSLNASVLSGESKQITGMRYDSSLEELCEVLAQEFEMSVMEVKLCKGLRVFESSDLSTTLGTLGIEQGATLLVLRDPLPRGVHTFNASPQDGVEFFKQHGWDNPQMLAELFGNAELGFNKHQVGDYLLQDHLANRQHNLSNSVLHNLAVRQDFHGQELDASMRSFFPMFYAPRPVAGQGAPMDAFVDQFARKYYADNPTTFASIDCVYGLTYSLLWLHSDLWSKHEFDYDLWMVMNSGINNGADFSEEYLKKLYDAALMNPCAIYISGPVECCADKPRPAQGSDHYFRGSLSSIVKEPWSIGRSLLSCARRFSSNIHVQ